MAGNKTISHTKFSGIKHSNNPLKVDPNSFSNAENVYLNKYNALISRPPIKAQDYPDLVYSNTIPKPIELKLVDVYTIFNGGVVYTIFNTDTGLYTHRYKTPAGDYSNILTYGPIDIPIRIVSFESIYGSPVESQSIEDGSLAITPSDPVRLDYTFLGWCDITLSTKFNFSTPIISNRRLYAKWDTIAPIAGGLDISINIADKISITSQIGVIALPFPEVVLFSSLSLNDTITVIKSTDFEITLSDTLSITSQIGVIALPFPEVVLFSSLSLNDTITVIKLTDFEITLSDTLSISSQISTFTSSDYNIQLTGLLTLTDDITVVKSTDFVVEISDLLTVASTISVTAFQYVVEELITTLTLQDSIDVIKSTDFVVEISDLLTVASTISVTAFQYVVRWYHYDGTYHDDVVTGGTNSYAPTVTPYTAAYIYAWPVSTIYGVTENTTVTETRTIRTYLVTFDTNGGSLVDTQNINYGTLASVPDDPTLTGYIFDNWYIDPALTTLFDFEEAITEDTGAYAKWLRQTDSPSIYAYKTTTWRWNVTNEDASTATIYADVGVNPPTTSRGDIASGGTTTTINTGSAFGGFTIYAQAQASGEVLSDVVSEYVNS